MNRSCANSTSHLEARLDRGLSTIGVSFFNAWGNYPCSRPFEWMVRYAMFLIPLWLILSVEAQAQSPIHVGDSTLMRDTLVESSYIVEHKPLRAGIEGSYGWGRYYDASVPATVTKNDCDFYSGGTGNDFGIRLLADMPLWGDESPWTFRPSLFLQYHRPEFDWIEADSSYNATTNLLLPFSIRHEVLARVGEAGIGSGFSYEFASRWHALAGANLGMIFLQSYQTSLHRVEAGLLFPDGTRDTVTGSGNLSNKLALDPSLSLGMNYDAPLSKKLWAEPGIEASLPFGGQAANGSALWRFGGISFWRAVEINATLTLLFDLTPRTETVPVFIKREIPEPRILTENPKPETRPMLTATIRAVALSSAGDTSQVVRMTVEEVRTRNADPILNYIFFDAGASNFPARYIVYHTREAAEREFQGSSERHNIKLMDLYRETLNILGDRMRKFPKSRVTLIGSTDNTGDRAASANSDAGEASSAMLLALARKRAEAVRDYLVNIWNIDPARLPIESSILPARPSPSSAENGRAENRRVEFRIDASDSAALHLTAPLTVTNIEHLATPDRIDLIPSVQTQSGISRSYATISAQGTILQSFRSDSVNSAEEKVWAPTEETLKNLRDSLDIDYDVWDSSGNHAHAHSSIPLDVIRVTSDRPERIERFSLILFGFDESQLGAGNDRSIRSAAEMMLKVPVTRVLIQGFTDEMGDPSHNDELSKARADNVRTQFEDLLRTEGRDPSALDIHSQGRGSRDLPYDNSLPEGRFFSRTVNITIERGP